MFKILISLSLLCWQGGYSQSTFSKTAKVSHQASKLNDQQIKYVASLSNMQTFDMTLDPILVPRVVGTPNHAKVRQYIIDQMATLGWNIETDQFTSNTPVGRKEFTNVIATLDPKANRRLVLACHYDSKFDSKKQVQTFIGATDSAVPCAMMISLARDMAPKLDKLKENGKDVTLQLLFLDGEEAFINWDRRRDAIYGSRNLAAKWKGKRYPTKNNREGSITEIDRMDLMVLLDLLGAANPQFSSLVQSGHRWYSHMADVETRLRSANLMKTRGRFFTGEIQHFGGIEDDHLPFMERDVPILHMIATPFPDVWHTEGDNKSALDYNTIDDLNKILRVFVAEYLQMSV